MSGILENLIQDTTAVNAATILGNPALESEIVLTALRDECSSDEEFASVMEAYGTEMALYGLISDADLATEAAKRIVITDFKAANFNRIAKRTAIRLAMVANDTNYAKYRKYRDLMIEAREKIYLKYQAKAKMEAKKIIANARKKASNMSPKASTDIGAKIERQIEKTETGKK